MSDRLHARFGFSSTATWLPCPYSAVNAVPEPLKKQYTLDAANEGTRVHGLFENRITKAEMLDADEDEDVVTAIEYGERFVRSLEPGLVYTEMKLKITDECYGYPDLINDNPDICTVFEVKNGKWDVAVYHNLQLLSQGAAYLPYTNAQWFRFVVYQPNGMFGGEPIKQWVAHRSVVETNRDKVLHVLSNGQRETPVPGRQCRWCKAFQVCPAMIDDAGFLKGAMTRRPEDLTVDQLARLLRLIQAFGDAKKPYEEALTVKVKLEMAFGNPLPDGVELKQGTKHRAWRDKRSAAEQLYGFYGAKGIKPATPAEAERLGPEGKMLVAVAAFKPDGEWKADY